MAVDIDDNNSVIQYSGSWATYTSTSTYGGTQFGGSSHKTLSTGSSVTLKFQGTGVRVYCSVPGDDGTVLHSKVRITLDGSTVKDIDKDTHPVDFNDDQWYDSGTLSNGAHTITATYTGSSSDAGFIFDRFNIDGTAVGGGSTAAAPAPAPVTTTTTIPKTTTATTVRGNPGTTIVTISNGHTVTSTVTPVSLVGTTSSVNSTSSSSASPSSSSMNLTSSMRGLQEKTVTVQSISTAADGSISTQTSIIVNTAAESHSDFPIGAIIGIAISGVLMLLLLIALLLFMRRRRRRNQASRLPEEAPAILHSPRRRLTTVTPFPPALQRSVSEHGHSEYSHTSVNPQLQIPNEKAEPGFDAASVVTSSSFNGHSHYATAAEEKANTFSDFSSNDHSTNSPLLPEIDTGPLHFLHYDPISSPAPTPSAASPSTRPSSYLTGDYPPAYQSLRHLSAPLPLTRLAPLRPDIASGEGAS